MKFSSYLIFFILVGVLPDFYLWNVILDGAPLFWKIVVSLPTLVILVMLVLIAAVVRYSDAVRTLSYTMFIFALPKAVMTLLSLAGRNLIGFSPRLADGIGLAAAVLVSLFFLRLIFHVTRTLEIDEEDLYLDRLPAQFDGLRLCQMTDLHLGSFGRRGHFVKFIVDKALSLHPDLIVFTGDLVNFESSEALPYRDDLSRLSAPLGVFATRGNHDYLLHGHLNEKARLADMDALLAFEESLGWRLLRNEHVMLERKGETVALVGVDNISANPFFNKAGGDFKQAMKGLTREQFKILLSHDPSHWRAEVLPDGSTDLTLSGHTHGLRYKLAGRHISQWYLPDSDGTYTEKGCILHVSKGLGSAFAFRLGGFPEIDVLTLRKGKSQE
jgi:hypothetical protein